MQFKNVKASELDGRVDLPGLAEWVESLSGDEAAVLITAPAGTGKTAAVGAIARRLNRDVMQCDLLQVFNYPDSAEALRNILTIAENVRSVVFQADGIDRLSDRFRKADNAGPLEDVRQWLAEKKDVLRSHGAVFIATGRSVSRVPEELRAQFDQSFTPGG